MKSTFRSILIGATLAISTLAAAAQTVTLDFEGMPTPSGYFNSTLYKGFDLSNNLSGNTGSIYWDAGTPDYPAFGVNNMGLDGTPGSYAALVITAPTLFTFTAATFTGCCQDMYIVATDKNNNRFAFGSFDALTLAGTPTFNLATDGMAVGPSHLYNFVNTTALNTPLKSLAFYGEPNTFAVDNVVLTPVPEANAFALTAVGLGVLGLVSRRRKQTSAGTVAAA